MLKIIYSKRGSGKTKRMIARANSDIQTANGDIVFIDRDNHCMLDLHHSIRYMNAQEYGELTVDYMLGFVSGVMASDYDIEKIYIDGVAGLFEIAELEVIVERISKLANKYNINVIISISGNKSDTPSFIKEYILEE